MRILKGKPITSIAKGKDWNQNLELKSRNSQICDLYGKKKEKNGSAKKIHINMRLIKCINKLSKH